MPGVHYTRRQSHGRYYGLVWVCGVVPWAGVGVVGSVGPSLTGGASGRGGVWDGADDFRWPALVRGRGVCSRVAGVWRADLQSMWVQLPYARAA